MRKDKVRAIELRKEGNSYTQIAARLNIPKSTLSAWLSSSEWSSNIKKELQTSAQQKSLVGLKKLNKIRGDKLTELYKIAESEAISEYQYFKNRPLFIAGIVSYWGEGDKRTRHIVRVTNTDSSMLKIFIKFLTEICGVPKEDIKAYLLIYPDLNKEACIDYWCEKLGVLKKNFNKCIVIQGRHKIRRVSYGVCTVVYNSTYLKKKIMLWIKMTAQELTI